MRLKLKIKSLLGTAIFINFLGYYSVIILILFINLGQFSRYFSIPLRVFTSSIMLYILIREKKLFTKNLPIAIFTGRLFMILYVLKCLIEIVNGDPIYASRSSIEILLYFIVYSIIPFHFFAVANKKSFYPIMYNSILISGAMLVGVSILLYGSIFLAGNSRLSIVSKGISFELINPLSIAYSSAIVISLTIDSIINRIKKVPVGILIMLFTGSLIPFSLGSSRGALIAVIFGLGLSVFTKNNKNLKSKAFMIFSSIIAFAYLLISYGGNLINRFSKIQFNSISDQSSRIYLWEKAIEQFTTSPILGHSIHFKINNYPHNILIESLMSTGLIGFTLLLITIFIGCTSSFQLIRKKPEYSWISILYWHGLISAMFSYSISTNVIFFSALGLVFGAKKTIKE